MENYCFGDCSSLTNITLPEGITSLGSGCFAYCSGLTNIILPEGITSLGEKCFKDCSSLISVSFPATLEELYDNIFEYARQKKRVILNAETPPDGGNFIDFNCTLYVPKGTLATYRNIAPWSRAGAFYEGTPISSISLPLDVSLEKTEKKKVTYSVLPINASQERLKWICDNSTIARIDEETGEISALKVGDATITAIENDGFGISASTTLHVVPLKVHTMQFAEPKRFILLMQPISRLSGRAVMKMWSS